MFVSKIYVNVAYVTDDGSSYSLCRTTGNAPPAHSKYILFNCDCQYSRKLCKIKN